MRHGDNPTEDAPSPNPRVPAYYFASVEHFRQSSPLEVLGHLAAAYAKQLDAEQRDAWIIEIEILREALAGLEGSLFLEFDIPRLGSRIDAVVLAGSAIFPIEFKCREQSFNLADFNQAWDYALDLKNFHGASNDAPILPILVATAARVSESEWSTPYADMVYKPLRCNSAGLGRALVAGLAHTCGADIDAKAWGTAPYRPTPTIIEAAQALYTRHSVDAISRSDAGARNLRLTTTFIEGVIDQARQRHEKALIFVTGVPGAGKTLVGLNIATRRRRKDETHAVFLSGNGPLVSVLQEALTRDEQKRRGKGTRKGEILQEVKPFIQMVHHFRDEGLRRESAPFDRVVIFDEAQRAWNLAKTADFMKRRKGQPNFTQSEPEFLLSYLDRHPDWAVVVCLVGGGQEIHTGEAGIGEWLDAARKHFSKWHLYISPELADSEYAAAKALSMVADDTSVTYDESLHLAVSNRSFRAEHVSGFVKAMLDIEAPNAHALIGQLRNYPIAVTRDLSLAKAWIREHARGTERFGLVASSQAHRLKPHAIDIRVNVNPVLWFLNDRTDTRSSYYLEDAATEFQIQGLELDWVCVAWCADLRMVNGQWRYHSFRGDKWENVKAEDRKRYLLNAYRVLLTRARQGMVVFVPPGDSSDPTRLPGFYDETFEYLTALGVKPV